MFADYWLGCWAFHCARGIIPMLGNDEKMVGLKIVAFPFLLAFLYNTSKSLRLFLKANKSTTELCFFVNQILPTASKVVLFYHDQGVKSGDPLFFGSTESLLSPHLSTPKNRSGSAVQQRRVRGNAQWRGHCCERMDCFLSIKSLMDTEKTTFDATAVKWGWKIGPGSESELEIQRAERHAKKLQRTSGTCGGQQFMFSTNYLWQFGGLTFILMLKVHHQSVKK